MRASESFSRWRTIPDPLLRCRAFAALHSLCMKMRLTPASLLLSPVLSPCKTVDRYGPMSVQVKFIPSEVTSFVCDLRMVLAFFPCFLLVGYHSHFSKLAKSPFLLSGIEVPARPAGLLTRRKNLFFVSNLQWASTLFYLFSLAVVRFILFSLRTKGFISSIPNPHLLSEWLLEGRSSHTQLIDEGKELYRLKANQLLSLERE